MKNTLLLIAVLVVVGCKAPLRTIKFDSDPIGARVFMTTGANEDSAKGSRNYLGVTPFQWTTEVNGDGTFKMDSAKIPFYSDFVKPVVVFVAEPPSGSTNLFPQREVFHGSAEWQAGNAAPDGVFFDMHKH